MAEHEPKPRRSFLPLLIAVLAVAAVVLVITGRLVGPTSVEQPGWQDALYSVLLAFTIDGTFLGQQNVVTLLGAFAAALVLYLAVLGGLWAVFRRNIFGWWASRSRHHVVVIGDSPDAGALARALRPDANVVLVLPDPPHDAPFGTIARPPTTSELITAAGIDRARSVVVMLANEQANAAIATAIAAGRAGKATPAIWCRSGDRVLADRVAAVESGTSRILVFDEAQLTARELFARHPAHAIAERMAAGRVHFVVAGFGRLGEAITEEAIFSGLAAGLGRPMVTIIDRNARAAEAIYRQNRPALERAADIAFIEAELITAGSASALPPQVLEALAARDAIARVTGIALCLGSDAVNTRVALALPDIRRREGRYFAPAFMRLTDPASHGAMLGAAPPHVLDPNAGVQLLDHPTRLMASDILDSAHRDQAAQRLHQSYSGGLGASSGAATSWDHLPETYRRANRRGADHIAAKLFSLGLTSERDPHAPILVERQAQHHLIGEASLDMLAALEHRRWSTDRIIDGWVYGAVRDDDLRHNPLLEHGNYAQLDAIEQRKDRDQIRTVLSSVVMSDGEGAMPEIRVALAGHRHLDPAEEQRATAALLERLLPRLASRHLAVTLVSPLAPGADMALCEAVSAALAGKTGQLRLIQVEAVPYRVVLDVAARETKTDPAVFAAAMLKRRQALFERFARVDIVRLGIPGATDYSYRRDESRFLYGLQHANAYLIRRTDLLGVLWDGEASRGPGGTGELVALWRDPSALPPHVDPGVSSVRPAPVDRGSSLIAVTVSREPAH